MVQPKTSPLSIRPGEARLAKIDAYALKHGLNRHAAVLELVDVGLAGPIAMALQRPTPKPVPGSDPAKRKAENNIPTSRVVTQTYSRSFGPQRAAPGSRLKGAKK